MCVSVEESLSIVRLSSQSETSFCQGKKVSLIAIPYIILVLHVFKYSILLVLSLNSILDCVIIKSAFNTEKFIEFITVIANCVKPGSVLVIDNCFIYKLQEVCKIVESRYCLFFYSYYYNLKLDVFIEA